MLETKPGDRKEVVNVVKTYVTKDTFEHLLINTLKKGASNDEINKLLKKLNISLCD